MEFPPNFFQQSCMLFSSVLSKVTIPVSSFNIQIHVHLEKSLRSTADSELLPCRSCSSLNARFWQELLFLTHRCTPQGRSWEWIQNKTVSVKYLSFRMREDTQSEEALIDAIHSLEKLVKSQWKNTAVNSTVTPSSACGHRIQQLKAGKRRPDPANPTCTRKCYMTGSWEATAACLPAAFSRQWGWWTAHLRCFCWNEEA